MLRRLSQKSAIFNNVVFQGVKKRCLLTGAIYATIILVINSAQPQPSLCRANTKASLVTQIREASARAGSVEYRSFSCMNYKEKTPVVHPRFPFAILLTMGQREHIVWQASSSRLSCVRPAPSGVHQGPRFIWTDYSMV